MSDLTPYEASLAELLQRFREGRLPEIPPKIRTMFDKIAARNPDLVAATGAAIRRVIEKTTN